MHLRRVLTLLVFLSIFAPSVSFAASGPNLVTNSSLETVSGATPQGWSSSVWGTTRATFTYPTTGGHTGSRYAKTQITTAGTGDAKWFPTAAAVTPGASYTFSNWYQSSVASEIDLQYTLSNGTQSYKVIGTPAASTQWKQFQTTFTVPVNAVSVKVFHLIEKVGTLSVDDYSLTQIIATTSTTTPPTPTPVSAPTCSLSANPTLIAVGSSSVLSWNTANASAVSINNGVGSVATTSGTKVVSPTATTTYTLTATSVATTTVATCFAVVGVRQSVVVVPSGSVTAQNAASVGAQDILVNVTNQPLGGFQVNVQDENVSIQSLRINFTSSAPTALQNVVLTDINGTVLAGPFDTVGTASQSSITFSGPISLLTGSHTLLIKGKVASGAAANTTVQASAKPASEWNITGASSGNTVVSNTANFVMSVMTIKKPSLTVSMATTPATQNIATGTQNFLFANVVLDTGTSAEDIKASSLPIYFTDTSSNATFLNGCQIKDGATALNTGSATPASIVAGKNTFVFNNPLLITKGTQKILSLFCNLSATASINSTYKWSIDPIANDYTLTGASSLTAVAPTIVNGTSSTMTVPTPVPPTSNNLIQNGNFEAGSANNPTGWTGDYWGSLNATFTYPVTGNGGGKAAKVAITSYSSGDAKWYSAPVTVSSHTLYTFSEDYTSTAQTGITVQYKMQDGSELYEWMGDFAASPNWSNMSFQVTVPKGAVSLSVMHTISKVGSLTIDNASLVALPVNPFANGMVSFVFDDGLLSQYQNALPILSTAGVKASFHIITTEPASGDSEYMTWTQIKDLKAKGHEIGNHTRTHAALTTLNATQLQSEVVGAHQDLVAQGITPTTFVYPYGDTSPAVQTVVKNAGYTAARGSYFGLNEPTTSRYNLFDIRLDKTSTLAKIKLYIDQAAEDKRWVIFELHDVVSSGGDDYAITPAFFKSVVDYAVLKGVAPVTLLQGAAQLSQ